MVCTSKCSRATLQGGALWSGGLGRTQSAQGRAARCFVPMAACPLLTWLCVLVNQGLRGTWNLAWAARHLCNLGVQGEMEYKVGWMPKVPYESLRCLWSLSQSPIGNRAYPTRPRCGSEGPGCGTAQVQSQPGHGGLPWDQDFDRLASSLNPPALAGAPTANADPTACPLTVRFRGPHVGVQILHLSPACCCPALNSWSN